MNKHILRRIVQLIFLIIAIIVSYRVVDFVAHRYCPYAVICFGTRGLLSGYSFIFVGASIAGLSILITTMFFGRWFCGYVCPLGTICEYLSLLNPKRKKMSRIPQNIDRKLKIGKYILLIFNIVMAGIILSTVYFNACPVMTLTCLSRGTVLIPGIFILILIVLVNILNVRAWCKYFCPYAALMNCFQYLGKLMKIKRLTIYRNLETCTDCNRCVENCQMNIDILNGEYVEDTNCIFCLECISVCPRNDTLTEKMR